VPDAGTVASLYERPLGEFVAARGQLAKALRATGDRAAAEEVAKLRRPTMAAWALDQVARRAPELVTGLLQAGAALREATAKAVDGDASSLRDAEARARAAADAVVARAHALSGGLNDVQRQRAAATLRAAVLDDEVAARLRAGTLDSDHEASPLGFDPGAAAPLRPPRPKPVRSSAEANAHRAERERLAKEADRLSRRAGRLQAEADEAGRRAADLRVEAKDAAAAARAAQRALATAQRRSGRPG
jgi:hypothetical protein